MIAGIVLGEEPRIAKLDDEGVEVVEFADPGELMEELEEGFEVVALEFPPEDGSDLVEEGFSFMPLEMRDIRLKTLKDLEEGIKMRTGAEVVGFLPEISRESLGVVEFRGLEAVLGAVTARFYQEDMCIDRGVQIPRQQS